MQIFSYLKYSKMYDSHRKLIHVYQNYENYFTDEVPGGIKDLNIKGTICKRCRITLPQIGINLCLMHLFDVVKL